MELALCLPLLMVFLLAAVQLAVVVRDALAVQHAAREGARAAAVSGDGGAAEAAATNAVTLDQLHVSTSVGNTTVTVTAAHVTHTEVPLIGWLLPDVPVDATVTMALEPP